MRITKMDIIFAGSVNSLGLVRVYWWEVGERPRDLDLMLGKPLGEPFGVSHSPTGFEWGYYGSGPAQLAFAMLYTFLAYGTPADESQCRAIALSNYQDFKEAFIAGLPQGKGWQISGESIRNWLDERVDFSREE